MSDVIRCSEQTCEASVANNKWARIRAGSPKKGVGWFFSKEEPDLIRCPDHLPEWVPAWRAKQREQKDV